MLVFKDLTCPYILHELFQHTSRIFSEETGLFLSFKNLLVWVWIILLFDLWRNQVLILKVYHFHDFCLAMGRVWPVSFALGIFNFTIKIVFLRRNFVPCVIRHLSRLLHTLDHFFDSIQVLFTYLASWHQRAKFWLQVVYFLNQLVIVICQPQIFPLAFARFSNSFFWVYFLSTNSRFQLSSLAFEAHIVLMHLVDLLHVLPALRLYLANHVFDLWFILVNLVLEWELLNADVFDLCTIASH